MNIIPFTKKWPLIFFFSIIIRKIVYLRENTLKTVNMNMKTPNVKKKCLKLVIHRFF